MRGRPVQSYTQQVLVRSLLPPALNPLDAVGHSSRQRYSSFFAVWGGLLEVRRVSSSAFCWSTRRIISLLQWFPKVVVLLPFTRTVKVPVWFSTGFFSFVWCSCGKTSHVPVCLRKIECSKKVILFCNLIRKLILRVKYFQPFLIEFLRLWLTVMMKRYIMISVFCLFVCWQPLLSTILDELPTFCFLFVFLLF